MCDLEKGDRIRVFLSHHSSKGDLTAHLSRYLEKNSIPTWYAPRDIRSGEVWDEAIHCAIKACKAVVLLFCAQADSSRQVKRELSLADRYNKPIFWLRIEKVEPNNLGYFLTSTQWLDWMDARDDALEKLVQDITALDASVERLDMDNGTGPNHQQRTGQKSNWTRSIFSFNSDREAAECAARVYFYLAQNKPDSSVVLPTGRSATALFRAMVRIAHEVDFCPFGDAHIISDTETFGVGNEHETSRTRHIHDMLIAPLSRIGKAPKEEQINLLSGAFLHGDPIKEAQRNIRLYPPSVHAISISPIGEILAYEVGTYSDAEDIIYDAPRVVEVGEHSKKYIDPNQPSKSIISIGLGTALSSEVLLILAFDAQKANIVNRMFNGPMTAGIPATLLRNHPNAFLLTTERVSHEAGIEHLCSSEKRPREAAQWIVTDVTD